VIRVVLNILTNCTWDADSQHLLDLCAPHMDDLIKGIPVTVDIRVSILTPLNAMYCLNVFLRSGSAPIRLVYDTGAVYVRLIGLEDLM